MNKRRTILSIFVIVLLLISFFSGNTFAKYITSIKTKGTLQVAKWKVTESFLVNGVSTTSETVNLANTYDAETLVEGKIAPGTRGSFVANIDATGTETGVEYKVTFSNISKLAPANLVYTYGNKEYKSLANLEKDLTGTILANAENKKVAIQIGWYWPYETKDEEGSVTEGDNNDTIAGEYMPAIGFDINITCTQVSPREVQTGI